MYIYIYIYTATCNYPQTVSTLEVWTAVINRNSDLDLLLPIDVERHRFTSKRNRQKFAQELRAPMAENAQSNIKGLRSAGPS